MNNPITMGKNVQYISIDEYIKHAKISKQAARMRLITGKQAGYKSGKNWIVEYTPDETDETMETPDNSGVS
jgi:hypothetical protein